MEVKTQLSKIGQELEIMMNKGTIDDAEQFLEQYSKLLHPNHYHMTTCKHNLMQMYGRTEGYLIQDMDEDQLARKKELCLEHLGVLKAPYQHLQMAERLLENETNENLPEGQLRAQVRETNTQLEGFMKTVGCQL